ncbi:MAG: aminotransferase class IV [Bacteroidota bacterium]|nr:aminotransferase class IV [Bacteroidota bacterium]
MKVYLNGKFLEKESEKISPFNSAFLYGEGIFETLRSYNGVPFRLSDHLQRMNNSLPLFGFKIINDNQITDAISELLKINKLSSARLRITVSKHINTDEQIVLIEATEYQPTFPEYASVMISGEKLPHGVQLLMHKTTNYFYNNQVYREAKSRGYDEAIFIDNENHILEGTRTNVFFVRDGVVFTPSLHCGVLPGITRKIIFEICKELNISIEEKTLDVSEFDRCDEVFLTNSLAEVIMVKRVNEIIYKYFSITETILNEYRTRIHTD